MDKYKKVLTALLLITTLLNLVGCGGVMIKKK